MFVSSLFNKVKMAHRFASVAKILTDQLVVRLLAENRALKLELFWNKYNFGELHDAMKTANQKYKGPDCNCHTCDFVGRKNEDDGVIAEGYDCRFKIYFENLLAECGMISTHTPTDYDHFFIAEEDGDLAHICMNGGNCVDVDTHIVDSSEIADWRYFTYGARIWKASSVDDPELRKLVLLFHKLLEDFEAMELSSPDDDNREDDDAE